MEFEFRVGGGGRGEFEFVFGGGWFEFGGRGEGGLSSSSGGREWFEFEFGGGGVVGSRGSSREGVGVGEVVGVRVRVCVFMN